MLSCYKSYLSKSTKCYGLNKILINMSIHNKFMIIKNAFGYMWTLIFFGLSKK